jgi:multidrug efflux pump subunit AcrB
MVDPPSASTHHHGAAVVVLGFISFQPLPITRMPNVDAPVISVTIGQFGASPAELESKVTKAIEDAVASVAGAHSHHIPDHGRISNTTILFRLETNTDRAVNDVKDAVTRARAYLPRGIDEPMSSASISLGCLFLHLRRDRAGKTPEQLSWFVETSSCASFKGCAASAALTGSATVEREIRVGLDPVRLQAVGSDRARCKPAASRQQRRSRGRTCRGWRARPGDPYARRGQDLGRILQRLASVLPSGGEVRLDDLGLVTDTVAEPRTFARF